MIDCRPIDSPMNSNVKLPGPGGCGVDLLAILEDIEASRKVELFNSDLT